MSERPGPIETRGPYRHGAGGIPAVAVAVRRTIGRMGVRTAANALRTINRTEGFDCPGCAWPERQPRHTVEFCESGAKAVAEEGDTARATPAVFARHSIAALAAMDDFRLGRLGRLTHPLVRPAGATHYQPIGWDAAFDLVASELRALDRPDRAIFYTSGRTSNEAAFAYQLLARSFGTNNLPDCSNLCHEPTSVALDAAIGIGKGSVTFEDFDTTDLVIVVGQNPGTNHPRMLITLEEVKRRGGHILAVNPLPEAGLLGFRNPQTPRGVLGHGTALADVHLPVRLGGDQALFRWFARRALSEGKVDLGFIEDHTDGYEAFAAAIENDPADLQADIGVCRAELEAAWALIRSARSIIVCWAMGITQHRDAVATIGDLTNFMLMTGNIGRPGAGLSPIRGHSNVQGDRTMGVWHRPEAAFLDALEGTFAFEPPREAGLGAVDAIDALRRGDARVLISLGGNLARSLPDRDAVAQALQACRLTVHISTRLNRSHLLGGELSLILPTFGRTDRDQQASGPQFVTVEDSFGTVHRSQGSLTPPSPAVRSEVDIVSELGLRLAPQAGIDWAGYRTDYRTVRADIERVVPGFERFEERVAQPGGFLLPHPPRDHRIFPTPSGRAQFSVAPLHRPYHHEAGLVLQTLRSHDQFNTTIYGFDDRYRGVSGGRQVLFVNPDDLLRLGHRDGDVVDVVAASGGSTRRASGLRLVAYPTPLGCAAGYYPELNVLADGDDRDVASGTPSFKSIPIELRDHLTDGLDNAAERRDQGR